MTPIPLTQPASTLQPFGKYLLVRKLAEGGMAELYLAKHVGAEGFERDVVVKCMLGHLSRHPEFVGMFLDEARLAARLFHPNIVQITDLGVAAGRHFLCMEYLPGEDLEAVIEMAARQGEPVPVALATRIILSACEGLEFAHAYAEGGRPVGLVHRDVSPSNILVTYQGVVKVVDFGIAKASSKLVQTQPGTLKGKLGYMSPEQARGEPLDARSDLFSLGVTFYELLTGRRVFQRDSELGVMLALMEQPIRGVRQVRPDVPEALERIVMRALARNRDERYQSAGELRADLEAFLAGAGSTPGGMQLGAYLRWLFGEQRARLRMQLPTLAELTAAGAVVAVPTDVGTEPTLVKTPVPDVAPRGSRVRSRVLGALGAVLVLGGGLGALHALRPDVLRGALGREAVEPSTAPVPEQGTLGAEPQPPVAPPEVEATAKPVTAAPAEDGAAGVQSDVTPGPAAGSDAQAPEAPRPAVRRTVLLDEAAIRRVLRRGGPALLACAERHRPELPASGVVPVEFTIRNSGQVTEAKTTSAALEGTQLGACLVQQLRALRFPRNHNTPELGYAFPMTFTAPR